MAGKIIWFNTKSTWIRNGKRRRSASSSQQKFFVLSCVFRSVVFESLSAMKINFSCTSLHRHSPWNFHFFLVFRCHWRFSGAPRREIKHIKTQHFGARKRISNSTARKASPSGSKKGVFFFLFSFAPLSYHKRSFVHTLTVRGKFVVLVVESKYTNRTSSRQCLSRRRCLCSTSRIPSASPWKGIKRWKALLKVRLPCLLLKENLRV